MLHLDDSLIIGKGAHRICYCHPCERSKCIKIVRATGEREQHLECKYYRKLLSARISWRHICRYYGVDETNLGYGYVYELIRDFNGSIALSVADYLSAVNTNETKLETVLKSLLELKEFLIEHKIIVRNLRPYNIVFKRTAPQRGFAVIIDNIGHHNNSYHFSDHIAFLARKDVRKKWNKFEESLNHSIF